MINSIRLVDLEYVLTDLLAAGHIECAARPSVDHALTSNWQDDPLDPAVAWRAKTTAELNVEKDAIASLLSDTKPVVNSVLEILYENPNLHTSYATVEDLKAAVEDRYQTKL